MTPRAAYIHVPFCAHRCGYCNFTVVAPLKDLIPRYLEAIGRELATLATPQEVDTLYFGGGTPTQLTPDQLERLFHLVVRLLPPAAAAEITVEANPADLNTEMTRTLRQLGVNRISLGAQSFHESKLNILERDHSAGDIRRAVELTAPFADVSLDLIFGVPGENIDLWRADLDQALALPVQHVSTYGLTFEKGTRYWSARLHGELKQLDEEVELAMYLAAIDRLGSAGLEHYEISNFARPGHRSRHNQVYWSGKEYYAFGPGAARYVDGRRETNHRSTLTYLKRMLSGQSPVGESEQLSPEERAREHLVFQLRMLEGVHKRQYAQVSGYTIEELVREPLAHYIKHGFMADDGERIRLTRKGLLISDSLWPKFLNS